MTRRVVAVLARRTVDDEGLAAAMLEDVVDLVAGMQQVEGALLAGADDVARAESVRWPDMPVVRVDATDLVAAFDAVHAIGAAEAALVAADVPDLPPLLLGKLFSALTSAAVAACPAADGRLCALAARLPLPDWLRLAGGSFDQPDALDWLRAAAPSRALHVAAGWQRVRTAADAAALDASLEGWEATRAYLGR